MCHCLLPPNAARLAAPTRSRWRVSWRPQNRRPNLSGGPLHFVTDPNQQTQVAHFESAPGGTRTHDPRLRRQRSGPSSSYQIFSARHFLSVSRDLPSPNLPIRYHDFTRKVVQVRCSRFGLPSARSRRGLSTATVYTLCHQGKLTHVRILNAIRIAPADLAAFIGQHRKG